MVILLLTSAGISDLSLEQAKFFLKSLKIATLQQMKLIFFLFWIGRRNNFFSCSLEQNLKKKWFDIILHLFSILTEGKKNHTHTNTHSTIAKPSKNKHIFGNYWSLSLLRTPRPSTLPLIFNQLCYFDIQNIQFLLSLASFYLLHSLIFYSMGKYATMCK